MKSKINNHKKQINMNLSHKLKIFIMLFASLLIFSCNSDDEGSQQITDGNFANGVFVLNEGGFTYNNASVSFISSTGEIQNNIFKTVNGRSLGDVAQSISFNDDLAYIVVNNSNTVEVVNRYTFESVATIAGELYNPRYIEFHNGKGYISNWGNGNDASDDFIAVVDLSSYAVIKKIAVPQGPERLEAANGKLYIAQRGDYSFGNTISVLDLNSETLTATIEIADYPNGMAIDNAYLFVLCSGYQDWSGGGADSDGAMFKINLQNNEIVDHFTFESGVHPNFLQIENGKVYYTIGKNIYRTNTADIAPSDSPFISTASDGMEILYGFNVDNGWIYACDAKDYQSNGELFVYSLTGSLESKYPISGIIPNGVYFND